MDASQCEKDSTNNVKIPSNHSLITVRFRDSRIAYGSSRYCHATVDNEFMNNLTPINRLILYGTTTNLRGRIPRLNGVRCSSGASNNSVLPPTSNALPTRRRGKQSIGVTNEEQGVQHSFVTEELQETKKRKRKDQLKSPTILNEFANDEISFQYKKYKTSKNTSEGTDEDSALQKLIGNSSNDGSTMSYSVSSKDPDISSFKSTSQSRGSKLSSGKSKQQHQQWERIVLQLDHANKPAMNSFQFKTELDSQYTSVDKTVNMSGAYENFQALLELRPIGCHAAHVKFFRPLELDATLETVSTTQNETESMQNQQPVLAGELINNIHSSSNSVVNVVSDTTYNGSNNFNSSSYGVSSGEIPSNSMKKGRSRSNSFATSTYSTSSNNNNINNGKINMLFDEDAPNQYLQHRQFFSERNHPLYTVEKLTHVQERELELERKYWNSNFLLNREIATLRHNLQETQNIYDEQLLSGLQKVIEKEKMFWNSLVSASKRE